MIKFLKGLALYLSVVSGELLHKCSYSDKDITINLNKEITDNATVIFFRYSDYFETFNYTVLPEPLHCEEEQNQWSCNYKNKANLGDFKGKIDIGENFTVFNLNYAKNFTQEVSDFGYYCVTANYTKSLNESKSSAAFNQKRGFGDKASIVEFKGVTGGMLLLGPLVLLSIPGLFIDGTNNLSYAALLWFGGELMTTAALCAQNYKANLVFVYATTIALKLFSFLIYFGALKVSYHALFSMTERDFFEDSESESDIDDEGNKSIKTQNNWCFYLTLFTSGLYHTINTVEVLSENPLLLIVSRLTLLEEFLPDEYWQIPYYVLFLSSGAMVTVIIGVSIYREINYGEIPLQGLACMFMLLVWAIGFVALDYSTYAMGTGIIENLQKRSLYFFYTNWTSFCVIITFTISFFIVWGVILHKADLNNDDLENARHPGLAPVFDPEDDNLFDNGPSMLNMELKDESTL